MEIVDTMLLYIAFWSFWHKLHEIWLENDELANMSYLYSVLPPSLGHILVLVGLFGAIYATNMFISSVL